MKKHGITSFIMAFGLCVLAAPRASAQRSCSSPSGPSYSGRITSGANGVTNFTFHTAMSQQIAVTYSPYVPICSNGQLTSPSALTVGTTVTVWGSLQNAFGRSLLVAQEIQITPAANPPSGGSSSQGNSGGTPQNNNNQSGPRRLPAAEVVPGRNTRVPLRPMGAFSSSTQ